MIVAKVATAKPVTLQYADVFKIPHAISVPFTRDVEKWIKHSGIEWTVKRLKDMKLDVIRIKAGLLPCSIWISQEDKIFKGSFGSLVKWASRDYKRWSKAILFLQMYTQYYSPIVTPSQEKKFLDGVNACPVVIPPSIISDIRLAVTKAGIKKRVSLPPRSIVLQVSSSTKREPHADGRSFPEGEATLECATSFTRGTRIGWDYISKYKNIFDIVEEGIDLVDHRDGDIVDYPNHVGKIGLIQEAGFKLRAVANPARVYQEALRPLGNDLYDILKVLPWDCTHNQELPMSVITEHLKQEKIIFSIDLSGATDYFPLDLQMEVLDEIFPKKEYINLFRSLSRAPWRYGKKFIRWTKGQPLGLYPSFASFALTHGLLLFALNEYKHSNMFFILGDDVVILDSNLNDKYRDCLRILDCPVSESKSITSSLLCEFAGRIVTREGIFSQLKWRTPSDDSFLDIVRNIGLSAIPLLRPRQQRVVRILSEVPDFMGGLGFNPKGKSLEERISSSFDLFSKEKVMSYLMSYNRKISNCNYYKEEEFPPYRSLRIEKENLDMRSISHVQRFLPRLINWYEILGSNLWTIDNDLSLPIDAPTGRRTRLEQLENNLFVKTSNIK